MKATPEQSSGMPAATWAELASDMVNAIGREDALRLVREAIDPGEPNVCPDERERAKKAGRTLAELREVVDRGVPAVARRESVSREACPPEDMCWRSEELIAEAFGIGDGAAPGKTAGQAIDRIRTLWKVVEAARELVAANDNTRGLDRPRPDIAFRNLRMAVSALPVRPVGEGEKR